MRCVIKWAHCCPTYWDITLFVCVLYGRQLLLNRRKDRRDWRCGRDLVRDHRHGNAWSSGRLLDTRARGMGVCRLTPLETTPPLCWTRSSHTVWNMGVLVPSFLSSCTYVIGHATIPRITVVYSSVVKLLFTIHQSQCTYTQQENGKPQLVLPES